ncbi:hypothetical protein ACLHDG_13905 [Sulfurovum sp. CS9]|uniref:hypothetical protein n=1 Tax=Sulfurovum sp. CS9 TaxID=3391146 RepID=UPI0039EAE538
MKHILFSLILLLLFSGCQDKKEEQAQHDAKIAQEARAELLKEQAEAKKKQEELEKNNKFSKIGITSEDGKIIIDTNKTKSYFKDLAHEMKIKMDKMSKDLEKGIVKNEEAGIEMNETQINIDLNKTKTFLDTWGKKMQGFVKEFDEIAKEFDDQNKTTKDTNATN